MQVQVQAQEGLQMGFDYTPVRLLVKVLQVVELRMRNNRLVLEQEAVSHPTVMLDERLARETENYSQWLAPVQREQAQQDLRSKQEVCSRQRREVEQLGKQVKAAQVCLGSVVECVTRVNG